MKRILLIRHAECDINLVAKGFVAGQSNSSPLTDLGRKQAAAVGKYLAKLHPTLASSSKQLTYSSTAVRAADTAAILLQQFKEPHHQAVVASPDLLELSQGDWEGKPRAECYTPEVLQRINADQLNFAAPGGESQQQLQDRMANFIQGTILPAIDYDGLPAVLVTHGLAIKCFLRYVLQSNPEMTWKIQLDNTSITEVMWCKSGPAAGWQLGRVNDTTHLALAGLYPALLAVATNEAGGAGKWASKAADGARLPNGAVQDG